LPIKWHTDQDDGIIGERIYLEARRIADIRRVSGASGRHGSQSTIARQNARAWIEIPYSRGGRLEVDMGT